MTPDKLTKGADGTPDIVGTCDDSELVKSLSFPVTAQTALLLDRIQVDHLVATGKVDATELSDLKDRIDWVNALLSADAPATATDFSELDAQRAAAQVVKERLQKGLDYYGHAADFVPLGSIESYKQRFDAAVTALTSIQSECDARVTALEQTTRTVSDLNQAKSSLTNQQQAYDAAVTSERASIATLIAQIATADEDTTVAKQALVDATISEFEGAVQASCGISASDLIDTIGQMAFLGEHSFQAGAMIVGQALKLGETAASKVLADDGTQVDKKWVIGQLTTTEVSASKLQQIVGGEAGIRLSDPGAVKLLAEQSEFDQLCDKFWNVSGAAKAKDAFDDYVSAVQARNAHIMTLNESLARLRAYVAADAQTTSALAKAQTQAAAMADAGASTLVAQLQRMASRARADCIEALYLASRAYSFWARQPADALALVLSDLSSGQPLGMSPATLQTAGEQLLNRYDKAIDADLADRTIWWPPKDAPAKARGMMIKLTPESHPAVFERLRKNGTTSFELSAARAHTTAAENQFAGLCDVRLSSIRCWLSGVSWLAGYGPMVRVDLEHQGRERLVGEDDSIAIFRHEAVHIEMTYNSRRPVDPDAIVHESDLQDGNSQAVGALIGPFARWKILVDPALNTGVDLSGVDCITLELHLSAQSFQMRGSV